MWQIKSNHLILKSPLRPLTSMAIYKLISCRHFSQIAFKELAKPQVCIVGSGPAGFYAAQQIQKKLPDVQIDMYEKLPVPYGLVRFGVAPDHPEVKNVINTFTKTASHKGFRFIGNVEIGTDVSIKTLRSAYHAVLLTYGAEHNRTLDIPGKELGNVIPARRIVGWYNGVPSDRDLKIDLNVESVAIFGQGNVAIDVARILLTPIDILKETDITQHALEQLSTSKIKTVHLIGRRGPLQAAFTIKELREMLKLPSVSTIWNPSDFKCTEPFIPNLPRPRKRITDLMLKSASEPSEGNKKFRVAFFRSPSKLHGDVNVERVTMNVNELIGDNYTTQTALGTDLKEELEAGLVIESVGYKAVQADKDIPFDHSRGIALNTNFKIEMGLYTSGWLATGPVGVILTTMGNAFSAGEMLVHETGFSENKPGFYMVEAILQGKQLVGWNDWLKIDNYEQNEGKKLKKPREKIVCIKKMLQIAS